MNTAPVTTLEKELATSEARRNFATVIEDAKQGYPSVISEHGKKVAAVVPLKVYQRWKKEREDFFAFMKSASATANLSPEDADRLATDAVTAIRTARRV